MTRGLLLRPPEPSDDRVVGAIARERYIELGVDYERSVRDSLGQIGWGTKHRRAVAVRDGAVIGYAWLRDRGDLAYVEVWVSEGHRGHGAGALLFDWASGEAVALGRTTMRTITSDDARVAAFLRARGFEPSGSSVRMDLDGEVDEPRWPAGFTIRTEDAKTDRLVDLVWRIDQAGFGDNPWFVPSPKEGFATMVARDDFDPDLAWFAFTDAGGDAGFCVATLLADGTTGVIEDLAVIPDHRRRGLARALLRHAIRRLRAKGATTVVLDTNARNERAQALYRSEGFEVTYDYQAWERDTD